MGALHMHGQRATTRTVGICLLMVGVIIMTLALMADITGFTHTYNQVERLAGTILGIIGWILVYKEWMRRTVTRLHAIAIGHITIYKRWIKEMTSSPKRCFMTIRFFVVIGIILWLVMPNIIGVCKEAIRSIYFFSKNRSLSYEEKMRSYWGHTYTYLTFVNDHTPSTAVIMRPPQQRPWILIGNGALVQSFLYPRRNHRPSRKKVEVGDYFTHILVAWGKWNPPDSRMYGWPKFPVLVRKFVHLPRRRAVFVDGLSVDPKAFEQNSNDSGELLENEIFDSEKKVNHHQLGKFKDHLIEYIDLTYTFSSYDYWTKVVCTPLMSETAVTVRVRANIRCSVSLIAEVTYENGKLAIFGSAPNKERNSWESLLIDDLYEKAKSYGLLRGWDTDKMRIARIGVNTGYPLPMPYLEKYGVIELERGQEMRKIDLEVDCAPKFLSLGNFYRAKDQIEEAISEYQVGAILEPTNPWIHYNLADMFKKKGEIGQAKAEYKRTVELAPDTSWFHYALGEVHKQEGEVDLAIESLEKAVKLDPDNSLAHNLLGEIYIERKEGKQAYARLTAGSRRGTIPGYYQCQEKLEKIGSIGKDLLQTVMENPQEKKSYYELWKTYYGFFGLPAASIKKDSIFDVNSLRVDLLSCREVKIDGKGRIIYPQQFDKPGAVIFVVDVPDELIELVIKPDVTVLSKDGYVRFHLSRDGIDYKLVYTQNGLSPSSEVDATEFAKDSRRVFFKIELFVDGTTSTSLKDSRIGKNFQVWAVGI